MPVSEPLSTLSLQLAATHKPAAHTLLTQSASLAHLMPSPQSGQPPPQSTSVSEPFLALSVQLPAGAAHIPLEHKPDTQSWLSPHS
jgi:hypothetical protein